VRAAGSILQQLCVATLTLLHLQSLPLTPQKIVSSAACAQPPLALSSLCSRCVCCGGRCVPLHSLHSPLYSPSLRFLVSLSLSSPPQVSFSSVFEFSCSPFNFPSLRFVCILKIASASLFSLFVIPHRRTEIRGYHFVRRTLTDPLQPAGPAGISTLSAPALLGVDPRTGALSQHRRDLLMVLLPQTTSFESLMASARQFEQEDVAQQRLLQRG